MSNMGGGNSSATGGNPGTGGSAAGGNPGGSGSAAAGNSGSGASAGTGGAASGGAGSGGNPGSGGTTGSSPGTGGPQPKTHKSKTHCDPTRIQEIQLLDKGSKRLENALIEAKNIKKKMTRDRRQADPAYAQLVPEPSDDESIITMSSNGSSSNLLTRGMELLRSASPKAINALASVVSALKPSPGPALSDDEIRDSLRFPSIPEVTIQPGMCQASTRTTSYII